MSGICGVIFLALLNVAVIHGAYQMKNLSSYRNAMGAAIVAMIPFCSPCYFLGIPFGVWALIVLLDERVKSSFSS